MMVAAIDPSINSSGLAIFDDGRLVVANAIKPRFKGSLIDRVAVMANALSSPARYEQIAIEWPQVYTRGANDRNDLLGLAGVCGAVAALHPGAEIFAYLPKEWAGNVPKSKSGDPKQSPRGARITRRLSGDELKIWARVNSHDTADAVGIGLHHLGRFDRVRVFPGAG